MWMSVLQLAAPLGVMIGYTVSGYMAAAGLPWQTSLLLQCACRRSLPVAAVQR